ncbi:tetratricopeptide repeat protein [Acidisoma sp. C75]
MVPMPLGLMLRLGTEAHDAGRLQEAEAIASNLLRAVPGDARVLQLSAIIAFRTGREALGIQFLERAIALAPQNAFFRRNISEMYRQAGRLEEALAAATQAVTLMPGDPIALHNLAVIQHQRGEIEQAIAASRRALLLKHDQAGSHFALAEAQLLRGEMAEGWERYEWRFRIPGVPPLMPPALQEGAVQWGGARLPAGRKLMLVGDQGFGDVIQFSRYIPWAMAQTEEIFLALSREMAPLISRMFPRIDIRQRWADCRDFAAFSALSSLPRLHGTRLDTIPPAVPVTVDPARLAAWQARLAASLPPGLRRIGIVWAGRPTHKNDRNRSIAFAVLAGALADLPGIALVSLQKGEREADAKGYAGAAPFFDAAPFLSDYEETAAAIAALDLVITVDTSVAHLGGAMAAPTWVLLPYVPDWRWLMAREDSPWYPALRLFRQIRPFDWRSPLAAIVAALGARAGEPQP